MTPAYKVITETAWQRMKGYPKAEVHSLLTAYLGGPKPPFTLTQEPDGLILRETFTGRRDALVACDSYREVVAYLLTIEEL